MQKERVNINKLITKFLLNEANLDELKYLEDWVKNPKNEPLLIEHIKINTYTNISMSEYDIDKAKEHIIKRIINEKHIKYRLFVPKNMIRLAAAIFIGIFVATIFYKEQNTHDFIPNNIPNLEDVIVSRSDKATLTLEDGSVVILDEGNSYLSENVKSSGEKIVYNTSAALAKEIVYNYLTIPRGGQFSLGLSDGTQVWLNAESQLKYPVNFVDGKDRQVELVYGEAYFEVSPSTEHKGAKFKVINQSHQIDVFGTKFNVKAYKDEYRILTTLVEGSVAVSNGISEKMLTPNQQSTLNLQKNTLSIANVNVKNEIAWINGIYSFKNEPLKEISKVISRWYDVDIIFKDKNLEEVKFRGVIDKDMDIEEILSMMKSKTINNYEINNRTITLN